MRDTLGAHRAIDMCSIIVFIIYIYILLIGVICIYLYIYISFMLLFFVGCPVDMRDVEHKRQCSRKIGMPLKPIKTPLEAPKIKKEGLGSTPTKKIACRP